MHVDSLYRQYLADSVKQFVERSINGGVAVTLSTHGWSNLGDHAINHLQTTFLAKVFPNRPKHVFDRQTLAAHWQLIADSIRPADFILLPGGGNMGDIWLHEEEARRKIISSFPKNPIISFPQSIYFKDPEQLRITAEIYNSHPKLMIAVRDDASYETAVKHFHNTTVVRTEDTVMGYHYPFPFRAADSSVAFVERDDAEKRSGWALQKLHSLVKNAGFQEKPVSTVLDDGFISPGYGADQVYRVVDQLHASRLVITDRLHGAIFALHAGRPVIVVDNSYKKISGALKRFTELAPGRVLFSDDDASNITEQQIQELISSPEDVRTPDVVLKEELERFAHQVRDFITHR